VRATGSVPNVIGTWGTQPDGCLTGIDGSHLSNFRDKYYLVAICGVMDPAVDRLEDTRIVVSAPFNIMDSVIILARYKNQQEAEIFRPTEQRPTVQAWHEAVLLPKDADVAKITRLSDVPRLGGKILRQGLYR
ncbi:MAG TPA: hypothetical protein VMT32_22245, partial [Bryobacteraceae bacterium]|nr:hypothetical protein [Bryobacteraceae bacterium]